MAESPKVAVVMGSDSDLPVMEGTVEVLERFGVPFELKVLSAHRSPKAVEQFAAEAADAGFRVIIAGAGGAAHLAGVIAAGTTLPVIGVPIPTDRMGGMDSLFSTIQMPSGVPVLCVGIGSSGAKNAAAAAVQILALQDPELAGALRANKGEMAEGVEEKNARVQQWLEERGGGSRG